MSEMWNALLVLTKTQKPKEADIRRHVVIFASTFACMCWHHGLLVFVFMLSALYSMEHVVEVFNGVQMCSYCSGQYSIPHMLAIAFYKLIQQ